MRFNTFALLGPAHDRAFAFLSIDFMDDEAERSPASSGGHFTRERLAHAALDHGVG